jgi:hypothetical protein
MNILRSRAQPELIYAILTDSEAIALREALRKDKSPQAKEFRIKLKKVLNAK